MNIQAKRREVMQTIENSIDDIIIKYLKPIDENWQASDFLPDARNDEFFDEIKEIRETAKEMSYDLWVVLIGDTITEEALPTYQTYLTDTIGIDQEYKKGWSQWTRGWTAEENRHGDLLNKYLYLSGQVDMREMEITTQHLINDGFEIGTGRDPYRTFVYTSFQEIATNISHRRVATLAQQAGNGKLAKICGLIAADEARHAKAYQYFIERIFELDPSEMMLALSDMMKKKIVMPAHFMRESGGESSSSFSHFSDAAQRTNVYTTTDYIDILSQLLKNWNIEAIKELDESAEMARDYLMALPKRLLKISKRTTIPEQQFKFKWVARSFT